MVDADDFKVYNDTRGHLAGNLALRRLARVLLRSVREVDVVTRYGGEEFALLLPNTARTAALKVGEKVRAAVEKAGIGREKRARGLTVSIGLATLPGDADDGSDLVEKADQALYVAKSQGKNRVRPFSDERREFTRIDASLIGRFSLLADQTHPITTFNLEPVECAVRVVRVIEEPDGYEVGARIIDISRPHNRRLRVFLASLRSARARAAAARRGLRPPRVDAPTSGRTRAPAGP
jgi:diguanylate cyclase (GGDEF)-like protein